MLELILIFTMASLGAIAFAILFKAGPSIDTADLESEKLRHDLAKLSKEEEKKKVEKAEKKQKQKKEEEKKTKNRSPPKQRQQAQQQQQQQQQQQPQQQAKEKVREEPESREIYVPNVPTTNNTFTTKPLKRDQKDMRSRSPTHEEKSSKSEVIMPSKKQIERDLSQGFVVVTRKGPPPLTAEQRKEREALRQKEEEEEKKREADALAREKERDRKRLEASINNEVSLEDVKKKLEKQKQERQSKEEERRQVKCVVKAYSKVVNDLEEPEKRSWGAALVAEGDVHTVDAEAYPLL